MHCVSKQHGGGDDSARLSEACANVEEKVWLRIDRQSELAPISKEASACMGAAARPHDQP